MRSADAEATELVLVLAPVGRDASVIEAILRDAGFACEICSNLADLSGRLDRAGTAVVAGGGCRAARRYGLIPTAQPLTP